VESSTLAKPGKRGSTLDAASIVRSFTPTSSYFSEHEFGVPI
jgi:hypothetical protein